MPLITMEAASTGFSDRKRRNYMDILFVFYNYYPAERTIILACLLTTGPRATRYNYSNGKPLKKYTFPCFADISRPTGPCTFLTPSTFSITSGASFRLKLACLS